MVEIILVIFYLIFTANTLRGMPQDCTLDKAIPYIILVIIYVLTIYHLIK